ncbi:MAG: HalOD1 output domain-containing protein [Haloarculaceae archaeon]
MTDRISTPAANDSDDGMDEARFDWRDAGRPSQGVIEALTEVTGRGPTEGPPLQQFVDVDAIDALLSRDGGEDVMVTFRYEDLRVTVSGAGSIRIDG